MIRPGAPRNLGGSWRIRRRIVVLTLLFCAAVVTRAVIVGGESRVLETAVLSAFGLAGLVIGSYVFGAVWEDNNAARIMATGQQQGGGWGGYGADWSRESEIPLPNPVGDIPHA